MSLGTNCFLLTQVTFLRHSHKAQVALSHHKLSSLGTSCPPQAQMALPSHKLSFLDTSHPPWAQITLPGHKSPSLGTSPFPMHNLLSLGISCFPGAQFPSKQMLLTRYKLVSWSKLPFKHKLPPRPKYPCGRTTGSVNYLLGPPLHLWITV